MSQSPAKSDDNRAVADYRAAWHALNELLRRGGSLSGNERNVAFLNCGWETPRDSQSIRFAKVSAVTGLDHPDDTRGMALVDWDHDGDVDLWTNNRTAPRLRLLINRTPEQRASVSLKLQGNGRDSNRDAIGARVELRVTGRPPLIRSLSAGHGYLSQSSKWLHFGLGNEAATIHEAIVTWPGGGDERFSGLTRHKHLVLTQGTGKAVEWKPPARSRRLPPSALPERPATSTARVLMPRRVPMPDLEFTVPPNRMPEPVQPNGRPLLLLLYASWCPHCYAELERFTANRHLLAQSGVEIILLSVEHLQANPGAAKENGNEVLQRIGAPFKSGRATEEMVAKLNHLETALFEINTEFAVPYSYLLDASGELVAIYRGPVPIETVLYDASLAQQSERLMRDAALPFAGRWYTEHPGRPALLELLADHFHGPFPADSLRYLEQSLPLLADEAAADHVRGRIAGLHYKLGAADLDEKRFETAEMHFRATLTHRPNYAPAHHDLGAALFSLGRLEEAEACFLKTLQLSPDNPRAKYNLEIVHRAMIRNQ